MKSSDDDIAALNVQEWSENRSVTLRIGSKEKSYMNRLVMLTLAIAFFACDGAKAHEVGRTDFAWWKTANVEMHYAAVHTAILAIHGSWELGYAAARRDAVAALDRRGAPDKLVSDIAFYPIQEAPTFPASTSYYEQEIDRFYRLHPPSRTHEIWELMFACFASKPSRDDCKHLATTPQEHASVPLSAALDESPSS